MRLVLDVLEFLLRREISRLRGSDNGDFKALMDANFLLGQLEYTKENLKDAA